MMKLNNLSFYFIVDPLEWCASASQSSALEHDAEHKFSLFGNDTSTRTLAHLDFQSLNRFSSL